MPRPITTERTIEAKWEKSENCWKINIQRDGKRRSFRSSTPGIKGKIEAEKKADSWLDQSSLPSKDDRLERAWAGFIEEMKIASPEGWQQIDANGRNWILPLYGYRRLSTITEQDWQDCINHAYKEGKSKKTLKNIRGAITRFHRYLRKQHIKLEYPEDIYIPNNAPQKEKVILQPDDIDILFSDNTIVHYGRKEPAFYIYAWRFFVVTGLRRGELVGLKTKDIKGNVMEIKRSVNKYCRITEGKNKNARRTIVLNDQAIDILKSQKEMLKKEGIISPWVFPDEHGDMTEPDRLKRKWDTYRKQHGIKSTIHELRHTMISIAKAKVPEQWLKQIVGHSGSMDTFGIYGHEIYGEKEQTADILTGIFSDILPPPKD